MSIPADVRAEMIVKQKARWRKGFPAARSFNEAEYTIDAEDGGQYYAYNAFDGLCFFSTTFQAVWDAVMNDLNVTHGGFHGGIIHIKRGGYTGNLVISAPSTIVQGERGTGTAIYGTTLGHAIHITADNCMVRDIMCYTTAGGGNNFDGIHIDGDYAQIDNVEIPMSDRDGIRIDGDFAIVRNSWIENADEKGIYLAGDGHTIENNFIWNTGEDAIWVQAHSDHNIIANNNIAIAHEQFLDARGVDGCTFEGNWCYGSSGIGVYLSGSDNIQVCCNYFERMYDTAIFIDDSHHAIVTGNNMSQVHLPNRYFVYIRDCSGGTISENEIHHYITSGWGIRIVHPSSGVVINCNRLDRSITSGIWLSGYHHAVTGNVLMGGVVDNSFGSAVANNAVLP